MPDFESDPEYQSGLETFRREYGNEKLWERLYALDPEYAETIHPNSYPYVMRGLEIIERTGRSKRDFHSARSLRYDVLAMTPYIDSPELRTVLYDGIHIRIDQMLRDGLVAEVQ